MSRRKPDSRLVALSVMIAFALTTVPGMVEAEDEPVVIICTNSALADFVAGVVSEGIDESITIEYIMPAGVCPSHFDTSPSDVVTIASADVIVSLGWEPWLADLLDASGNDDAYSVTCAGLEEWNYPAGASMHLDVIADGLSGYNEEWSASLAANAVEYADAIADAYEDARLEIESLGLNGTKVVTIDWYVVFLEGLGFEVAASYSAPESMSTEDVLELTAACEDPEIAMVVDNLQSTVDFGSNLAAEMGKEHVVLSNFPGAIPGKYTYIENMEYNVDCLVDAAVAYEETAEEISELESEVSSLEFQRLALLSAVAVLAALLVVSVIVSRRRVG